MYIFIIKSTPFSYTFTANVDKYAIEEKFEALGLPLTKMSKPYRAEDLKRFGLNPEDYSSYLDKKRYSDYDIFGTVFEDIMNTHYHTLNVEYMNKFRNYDSIIMDITK